MKYHIFTYGCQMNHSDSERIAANLENFGYKPAKKAEAADLIVINACSVRQSAIHRVYSQINKHHKNKNIILAGCVLEADKKKLQDKIDDFWHPDSYFEYTPFPRSSAVKKVQRSSAFLPIMTGCNNFCSYCVVPYTRGREKSRPADEIIQEIKSLVRNGYKEIILLGQNVNSYKSNVVSSQDPWSCDDKTLRFYNLLHLLNTIPGDFVLKFLTSHPKDMSDELINTIADCEKVSKEIHLPIQSGDNTILKKMNRKYTVTQYKKLIKKIQQKIPNATISTDVIVGFPGETKKQFQNTVKLFKEMKFKKAYVSMYSPRPGTAAYKLEDNVPQEEKRRRWKILDGIVNKKAIK